MKTSKIIAVALAATLFTAGFTSCGDDYDDTALKGQITDLDKRVTTLEEKVNADIAAIQASINTINGNNFVKTVKKVADGYEITFSDGTVATIKNGKDGANGTNGTNGKDGVTPVLTAVKDADEQYYWQVNGEWLMDGASKVPASRTPEIKAVAWVAADGGDDKNYWQIDGSWLLDADGNKILVTADAEPVKFDAGVDEAAGTITFSFKQADGSDKDYVVNLPKSELAIVEAGTPGVMFVGEENTYTVAIPEGWNADEVIVRADVASDDANGTSITRTGSWTSFKVDKTTNVGSATIKATPAGYIGGEIAELTVAMTNANGEKLAGSIFVKMAVKEALSLSSSDPAGTIATKLAEEGKYYNAITVGGTTAMDATDWTALKDYPYATSLEISNTAITEVPANALEGNTVLTSFTGNASLATIGDNAFAGCENLATLNTVSGVTSVGASAFAGCVKITNPTFGTLTALGANAFNGCTLFSELPTLDSGVTELSEGVFAGTALTAVSLANVTTIGNNAFKGCTALAAVTFDAVTSIGESAFEGATVGGNWTFGGSSLDIADRAFAGCDFASHTLMFSSTSAIATIGIDILDGATTGSATVSLYTGSAGDPDDSGSTWAGATWATVTINS